MELGSYDEFWRLDGEKEVKIWLAIDSKFHMCDNMKPNECDVIEY